MSESKKSNKKILAILFVGVLMGALDISIVDPAIPALGKSINIGRQTMSLIFSVAERPATQGLIAIFVSNGR